MITFEEAYKIVMKSVFETETETIPFSDSSGRILDEDILSDIDMPPFNRSAVDGFACHRTDLKNDLEVLEIIAAGEVPKKRVEKNQCSKIMTGAIVPEGCDVVFMVEESQDLQNGKIRFTGDNPKMNMSFRAEDVRTGDIVLEKGKFIKPQDIAIMASVGHTEVLVKKRPVVGIISTGSELIEPEVKPAVSQIRNSNAYQLNAQVLRAGGIGVYYGIAPDNETITYEKIANAVHQSDIVIITGGVSMGDFDFVPSVLEHAGVKILFDRVRVQPGKPTTFGIHPKAVIFGLPGNPVSSFIQFEMLIRPLINKMMGYNWIPIEQKLPLAMDYERKSSDRLGLIPVYINKDMEVVPADYHGSAHIAALSYSDGIIALQPGIRSLTKGEIVNVRQI
jgi:molybdopterin molybdotransferase